MSAHRVLKDLFKAFMPGIGPGIVGDPGDAGTITFDKNFQICEMTSGSSGETRTLANPNRAGIRAVLRLDTDGGGDIVVTASNGLNVALDTVMTFEDASDLISMISVTLSSSSGTYRWEILEGNVGPVAVSSSSPSSSVSSSPSSSASSSPSTSPSSSVSSSPSTSPSSSASSSPSSSASSSPSSSPSAT